MNRRGHWKALLNGTSSLPKWTSWAASGLGALDDFAGAEGLLGLLPALAFLAWAGAVRFLAPGTAGAALFLAPGAAGAARFLETLIMKLRMFEGSSLGGGRNPLDNIAAERTALQPSDGCQLVTGWSAGC